MQIHTAGGPKILDGLEWDMPLPLTEPLQRFRIVDIDDGYYQYIAYTPRTGCHHYEWKIFDETGAWGPPIGIYLTALFTAR